MNRKLLVLAGAVAIGMLIIIVAHYFLPQPRKQLPYNETFEFKGHILSYKKIGEGRPVILLHGSLVSNPWLGWEEKLAQNYTLYLPELPGYGASDEINGEVHNVRLLAESICAFAKQKEITDASFIGHSLGAVVGLYTREMGCLNSKIILLGLPVNLNSGLIKLTDRIPLSLKRYLASTRFGKEKFIIPVILSEINHPNEPSKTDVSKLVEKLRENAPATYSDINVGEEINYNVVNLLNTTQNDYVFIFGQKDGLLQEFQTKTNKEAVVINGAEHNIFISHPDESLEVVKRILDE